MSKFARCDMGQLGFLRNAPPILMVFGHILFIAMSTFHNYLASPEWSRSR